MSHTRHTGRNSAYNAALFQKSEAGLHARRRAVGHTADALEEFSDGIRDMADTSSILAIETYFEAALASPSDEQILRCIDKGVRRAEGVIDKDAHLGVKSQEYVRAHVLRAYAPFFGSFALTKSLPNPKMAEGIYDRLVGCAEVLVAGWEGYDVQGYRRRQGAGRLSGTASELLALLLFQRFAAKDMADGTWHPAPTMFSDGRAGTRGSVSNHNWDISCFTQLEADESPALAYKVEIKSAQGAIDRSKRTYDEDIHVIPIKERVLAAGGGHASWPLKDALTTVVDEHKGVTEGYSRSPAEILRVMTNSLLDAIDE